MGFKGHFFYGMQTDGHFQERMESNRYLKDVLVHHKSGFLRFGKPDRPLTIEVGLETVSYTHLTLPTICSV